MEVLAWVEILAMAVRSRAMTRAEPILTVPHVDSLAFREVVKGVLPQKP